jgi:hypothetical protein
MTDQNQHSRLAPSAAKRWVNCTASIAYCQENADRIPEDSSSSYADEGTIAHDWAANVLRGLNDLSEVPEDMQPHVKGYVDLAQRLTTEKDKVYIESKVPLFYKPEDAGTVDFALVSDERVYILDLKYGQGVIVDAKENMQLATYALSLIRSLEGLYDFNDETLVTLTIYQPRTYEGSPTKIWATSLADLREFGRQILEAAIDIDEDNRDVLKFAPSDEVCQFCPAKGFCKARQEQYAGAMRKVGLDFLDDLSEDQNLTPASTPSFESLDELQIAAIVRFAPEIKKWLNSVESEAHKALEAGKKIEGLKLVKGKEGNRQWKDEEEADKLLKGKLKADERYTKKLITLPQAEKALKSQELSTRFQNQFKELTFRAPAKPVLALEDDPREAIQTAAEEVLPNHDDEDLM